MHCFSVVAELQMRAAGVIWLPLFIPLCDGRSPFNCVCAPKWGQTLTFWSFRWIIDKGVIRGQDKV
ncbi:hypothetical protein Spiaf_0737 [Spirochaeta africana DSM 8902]|uniref:Uncharacterized protein n=1 Tax=Spirochaeta africana (strain ATCC 700263 / DSM 8902 / Z-7692) TaxID=889378 RepID=H9UH41_SPIAZ|nr:hypothetical protein Spiaf_0737 [Spirochaeta africana DSM 8902]